jgi:predicted PurR-regulated permease PerM
MPGPTRGTAEDEPTGRTAERELAGARVLNEQDHQALPPLELPHGVELEGGHRHRGRPLDRQTPFFIGLTGALGVAVAYVVVRAVADIAEELLLIGLALFLAVGLNPIVEWVARRRIPRGVGVAVVIVSLLGLTTGFVFVALPPIVHETHTLIHNFPKYRHDLATGKGTLGRLAVKVHLTSYLSGAKARALKNSLVGGALGAGERVLSAGIATLTVIVLTIYFLIALPAVKRLWLRFTPASRRARAEYLTEQVFGRVGGFVLGNLLTSIVAALGTFFWLVAVGGPYPLLLALFVGIFDLLPVVGSTIAGLAVAAVMLTRGLPLALATGAFYTAYRFFEDYLLTPRVMHHTVKISPGVTIVATLIGGALLGLVGALIAIPCAATIYLVLEEMAFPRLERS